MLASQRAYSSSLESASCISLNHYNFKTYAVCLITSGVTGTNNQAPKNEFNPIPTKIIHTLSGIESKVLGPIRNVEKPMNIRPSYITINRSNFVHK